MDILLELRTAFNVNAANPTMSHGEERISEHVNGLKAFFKYEKELLGNNIQIYLTDNTISDDETLDERILDIIPHYVKIVTCDNNIYGPHNKGAGIIEQWRYNKELISRSEWYIYYEPRQLLVNFNFFESFLRNPRTLFTMGSGNRSHFNTGLFAMKSKDVLRYMDSIDLEHMVKNQVGIEYSLYDFMKQNNIQCNLEEKMNVIWLDAFTNTKHLW